VTELPLWKTLSEDELKFIAGRDYGVEVERHLEALKKVVFDQDGYLGEGQYWFPYEVIELCSYSLEPGHAREFVACTLLVIRNVVGGYDRTHDLSEMFDNHATFYAELPPELSEQVMAAYIASGLA